MSKFFVEVTEYTTKVTKIEVDEATAKAIKEAGQKFEVTVDDDIEALLHNAESATANKEVTYSDHDIGALSLIECTDANNYDSYEETDIL